MQLTDLCRTLNEDPVLEQIRIDNHVTYDSRKEEEEKEYTPKTHSFIQEITTHEVTHMVKGRGEVHAEFIQEVIVEESHIESDQHKVACEQMQECYEEMAAMLREYMLDEAMHAYNKLVQIKD
jgi:hypothetical protein